MKNSFVALQISTNSYLKKGAGAVGAISNEWAQREGSGKGARPFITLKIVCHWQTIHYKSSSITDVILRNYSILSFLSRRG